MKVLLINPPMDNIVKSTISSFVDSIVQDNPMPPLGLMYLASYILKHTKHDVRISDLAVEDTLLRDLREYNPDIVGITTTTLTLYDALQVAKTCKLYNPRIITVIGGAHTNIYPAETASFNEFDFIVLGEGEKPLLRLLEGYRPKGKFLGVDIIDNLDDIPFPARDLIDISKYHSAISKNKLVTSMVTSRGCPYNCSFCYQPHYKKWRARSSFNIVGELLQCEELGIKEIEIYDDTFTYDRDRVIEICEQIDYWGVKLDWAIRTRIDCVDKEMLQLMAKAGCKRINYGIESVTPSVLKTLRKGFNMIHVIDALRDTIDAGIEVQAYFMLGSPTETREQMLNTIKFANKYIPDYAYYSITSPFPGTALYEQGLKEGKYNDYWKEFAKNPTANFKIRFWDEDNREELIELFNYGYRSFYSKPSRILKQLANTKSMSEFIRKSKLAIGVLR